MLFLKQLPTFNGAWWPRLAYRLLTQAEESSSDASEKLGEMLLHP